jgi:sulfhydrogenase subunit gamma (sulfur reductase)
MVMTDTPHRPGGTSGGSVYEPRFAKVLAVREEIPASPGGKPIVTLSLERGGLDWRPGQFLEVGMFPWGEVPISISSPPGLAGTLCITVRAAGVATTMLTQARPGDVVGVRGPCGNGFQLEEHLGHDVLFVAGGLGLPPLRGLLEEMLLRRSEFGRIVVIHGARSPRDLLFPWQYAEWRAKGVELMLCVDMGDGRWENEADPPRIVGFPTMLFPRVQLDPARTVAYVCGPPIMIRVSCQELTRKQGIRPDWCVATLEKHMKCGIGKCGHCITGDRYVCMDGPVFRYDELTAMSRLESPW